MNPETHDYCHQCRLYEAVAEYDYQLSSPAKRKCRHLERCRRVAEIVRSSYSGEQMNLAELPTEKRPSLSDSQQSSAK